MFVVQIPDPYIDYPPSVTYHPDASTIPADVEGHYEWWHAMIGHEFPADAKVHLNVDHPAAPSVYFLTIEMPDGYTGGPQLHVPDYPRYQIDMFHVIVDDTTGGGDLSEVDGRQCRDCGAVNAVAPDVDWQTIARTAELPENVKPVWRQAADGAHVLCDPCADKEGAK